MGYTSDDVVSAGFCRVLNVPDAESCVTGPNDTHLEWECYGDSKSLNKSSQTDDSKILAVRLQLEKY